MNFIPWRVKNFLSERFPLLYHLAINLRENGNSPAHWDQRLAQTWDDPRRHWPAKTDLIASLTRSSDVILDIGCGNGGILRSLKGRGYQHLHGLEISDYAIKRLGVEGIEMHYGLLPKIPLPDALFDVVIASQVLEHIIRRRLFLKEIRRVIKPGGMVFFFVPTNCLGPIDEKEHVIRYNADSLRRFVSDYFSVIKVESMRDPNHEMQILFAHVRRGWGC